MANLFAKLVTTLSGDECYNNLMLSPTLLSVTAILCLVPAAILPYRRSPARDAMFWVVLAIAIIGSVPLIWSIFAAGWRTGFAPALWLTVATTLVLFAVLSAAIRDVWRLAPLVLAYMGFLGLIAGLWLHQPDRPLSEQAPTAWVQFHILISVVTYGLLTIGAIAGFSVILQERALKRKRPGGFVRRLPSVADGERIQVGLLVASCVVLGCDLVSGMTAEYFQSGMLMDVSHKTMLSMLTFAVIIGLLLVHARTGVRGRRAARYTLVSYLLITLAYPGVKFVTDVVLLDNV